MRIPCPFCGPRDVVEFTYLGDATVRRPDPSTPDAARAFHDYTYVRANPAGRHEELWYHSGGCRSWIRAVRDTRTHAFEDTELARTASR